MRRLTAAVALITAAGALTGLTALTACSASSAATTASGKPLSQFNASVSAKNPQWSKYTFVLGDNGGDGTEALAQITGVFANAPYKVTFARFTYGPPLVQAAASGDIDLGSVGDVPPVTGAATEYGFSVVGVAHYINASIPDEDIIVPKGSPIQTLSQLRGKKIAVPEGSSANGLVLLALKSVGLTPSDVQLDFLSPAAGATAFQSGKVDAWAIWNPQVSLAIQQGARIIAKGLPPIDQASNYYVAPNRDLTGPRRAAFTDLLERLGAEFAWANKHPAEYAQAIAQEDDISLADAQAIVPASEFWVAPVESSDVQAEQALADAFLQAGQIKKAVNIASISQNVLPAGFDSMQLPGT
jgi:sulfonate transport system substrate-binding protein